jgi:hypothetical protein
VSTTVLNGLDARAATDVGPDGFAKLDHAIIGTERWDLSKDMEGFRTAGEGPVWQSKILLCPGFKEHLHVSNNESTSGTSNLVLDIKPLSVNAKSHKIGAMSTPSHTNLFPFVREFSSDETNV